jgi:hypothetical protein
VNTEQIYGELFSASTEKQLDQGKYFLAIDDALYLARYARLASEMDSPAAQGRALGYLYAEAFKMYERGASAKHVKGLISIAIGRH